MRVAFTTNIGQQNKQDSGFLGFPNRIEVVVPSDSFKEAKINNSDSQIKVALAGCQMSCSHGAAAMPCNMGHRCWNR